MNGSRIKRMTAQILTQSAAGIQSGEVTHHQDQLINPVNFSTRNTINVTPQIDMPDLLLLFILAIFSMIRKYRAVGLFNVAYSIQRFIRATKYIYDDIVVVVFIDMTT